MARSRSSKRSRRSVREESRAVYRQAIVEAAMRIFGQTGFREAKIADIAAEAGVATGTLYNYFSSKEEIFQSILDDGLLTGRTLERDTSTGKKAGVERFIYMSSCSVYGTSDAAEVSETSALNPQSAYAVCKARVERDVSQLAGGGFAPVFLRNATAYGASPRMRFDLVVNNLAGFAWTANEVRILSDG